MKDMNVYIVIIHMPIGILRMYRLLFLSVFLCLFVCKIFVRVISGVG